MANVPPVRIARNLKLIGHSDLGGAPNAGEGMGVKITPDGRRILYIAHENPPMAFSILDVTDPSKPTLLWQLPIPHADARANSLALRNDLLLLAYQCKQPGQEPAGFQVYDVSNPVKPKEVSFFDVSGPHSQGVHFVFLTDGRFAHISTGAADFEPNHPKDHQFYMIVDLENPSKPREVGRWWMPGQRKGDKESLPPRHTAPSLDFAFRLHNAQCYPERPDRAYLGYIDGGIVILDIADKGRPRQISRLDYHPPFPGFTHTVVPLFDRNLLVVTDEATGDEGLDWPKRLWMVDVREETNPVMISSFPTPEGFEELHRIGGRIGAHNIHENETEPGSAKLQYTVAATWFSAGLRIYDISDPFRPEEIGAFLPETPPGQRACRISDVFVEDRNVIYAADRARGGLYILEYTGRPLT
ncbi:MAG TPA: hypothetical protein VLT62_23880 [Candidatus Methylomirabilis sp.]|nr:hypothetical protein [Candidatus Methylomirabilis sp.]